MPKIKYRKRHVTVIPLSNKRASSGDEQNQIKGMPATQFRSKHAHASQNKKVVCCLVGFMQNVKACNSGVLSTGSNCGQNGLCKFLVIGTGLCPIDFVHPCMLGAFAPTKLLCEQVAKTSGSTAKDKNFTYW